MRLGPIKKKLVYHPRPRLNSWPHRIFFFICWISYENEVNGFVSVVVLSSKFIKTRSAGRLGY